MVGQGPQELDDEKLPERLEEWLPLLDDEKLPVELDEKLPLDELLDGDGGWCWLLDEHDDDELVGGTKWDELELELITYLLPSCLMVSPRHA